MIQPKDGFDLLDRLRKDNGKPVQNFRDLAGYLGFKAREKGFRSSVSLS